MSEWRDVPLSDLVSFASGGTPSKSNPVYWDGEIPWISGASLKSLRLSASDRNVTTEAINNGTKLAPAGAVLILVRGMSLHQEIRVGQAQRELAFNQDLKALEAGPHILPDFLLYALDGRRKELLQLVHAAGHGTGVLAMDRLQALPIALPGLVEQRRIAAVLGAFDDLIETIRVLADQLHDAARAVGLKMLENYGERDRVPLTEVAAITRGFSYRSEELAPGSDTLVNLKNFGRGGVFNHDGFKPLTSGRFKPSQVLHPGDVAISMTDLTQQREVIARPIRIPRVSVEGQMVASLDLAIARPLKGHDRAFVAAVLSQEAFHTFARNYCNGTTVLHMSIRAFEDYSVPSISPAEAEPFVQRVRALNEAEDSCREEAAELTRTRDELLPLLMSGRVRVEDVEGVI